VIKACQFFLSERQILVSPNFMFARSWAGRELGQRIRNQNGALLFVRFLLLASNGRSLIVQCLSTGGSWPLGGLQVVTKGSAI
jgi:hypothetical protein